MASRAASRPAPGLSPGAIIAAAVALADTEGVDAVSMRRVAARLGVEAMSLYRWVPGKDALLDGMVDRVIGEFPLEPADGADWRARLEAIAFGAHAVLVARPWAAGLAASRAAVGPNRLAFVDAVLGALLAGGADAQLAHDAMHGVVAHVFGFTLEEQRLQETGLRGRGYELDALLAGEGGERYAHIGATIPVAHHDHEAEYAFVLALLLDGLAGRLRPSAAVSPSAAVI